MKVEQKRGEDLATARHILYIGNSGIYDMPVMDNIPYQGRMLDDLTREIQDKGILLSVLAPRRLQPLLRLFEKSGGDLEGAKKKLYAKEPRDLVLLNGFALQERSMTPKPLPQPSESPNLHENVGGQQGVFSSNQAVPPGQPPQQIRPPVAGGQPGLASYQPPVQGPGVMVPGQQPPGNILRDNLMAPGAAHPQRPGEIRYF